MTDQPALGPEGQLLDATEIKWYNDLDDTQRIQHIQPTPSCTFISEYDFIDLGTTNTFFCQVNAHIQFKQLQAHG